MPPTTDPLLHSLEDFIRGSLADNSLLAMALVDGAVPTTAEVLQFAGHANGIYMLATIHCQSLPDRV